MELCESMCIPEGGNVFHCGSLGRTQFQQLSVVRSASKTPNCAGLSRGFSEEASDCALDRLSYGRLSYDIVPTLCYIMMFPARILTCCSGSSMITSSCRGQMDRYTCVLDVGRAGTTPWYIEDGYGPASARPSNPPQ